MNFSNWTKSILLKLVIVLLSIVFLGNFLINDSLLSSNSNNTNESSVPNVRINTISTPEKGTDTLVALSTSIIMKVTVSAPGGETAVDDYVLRVKRDGIFNFWTQEKIVYNDVGEKTIEITDLKEGYNYVNLQVGAYEPDHFAYEDHPYAKSDFMHYVKADPIYDVDSLTTPDDAHIVTTKNSASISTTASSSLSLNSNQTLNEYVLRVEDSSGAIIGTQNLSKYKDSGEKTIELTGLATNKLYQNSKITAYKSGEVGGSSLATSGNFNFTTEKLDISSLSTPEPADITTTKTTADITTTSLAESLLNSTDVNDYVLQVENSDGVMIGTQSAATLTTDGPQTISLTELDSNKTYSDSKITAYKDGHAGDAGNILATSGNFDFTTDKLDINTLTTPAEADITTAKTTADIKTTVSVASSSNNTDAMDVNDYVLQVEDSSGALIGTQDKPTLSTDGLQTVSITELDSDHTYTDSKIVAYKDGHAGDTGNILATSGNFNFTTSKLDIDSLTTPVEADIATTKTTADITTTVSAGSSLNSINVNDYVLQVEDSSGALIGAQDKPTLSTDGLQIVSITGLSANTLYDDSKIVAYKGDGTTELARSGNFDFTTDKKDVNALTTPDIGDITTTQTTADIKTKVSSNETPSFENKSKEAVNEYVLQVQTSSGAKIGTQGDVSLTEDGSQKISLTGLSSNTEYTDSKIVAYSGDTVSTGTLLASTSDFTFTTSKKDVNALTTPVDADITTTKTSADITTTVSAESSLNNIDVNEYVLQVEDSNEALIGTQTEVVLNTDGPQTISITGLDSDHTYSDSKIVAYKNGHAGDTENILATSGNFNFSTNKLDIDSLTTPVEETDITTTQTTADITTTVSAESLLNSINVNEYVLQVEDNSGALIGVQDGTTQSTDGDKTINITNLTANTNYNNSKITAYKGGHVGDAANVLATSGDFDFSTNKNDVVSLTTPDTGDITTTQTTADITTTVSSSELPSLLNGSNETLNKYVLQVQESDGTKIGTQSDVSLTEDGIQTISLTGLEYNKTYEKSKIVAYSGDSAATGTLLTSTKVFTFTTLKYDVAALSTPDIGDITTTQTTADIKTTVTPSAELLNDNTTLNDYVLQVEDNSGVLIGLQTPITLNIDGPQTISLTGLTLNTTYTDSKIVAYKDGHAGDKANILASSNSFEFSTAKGDVTSLTTPTDNDISTTQTTADIKTIVNESSVNENRDSGDSISDYVLKVVDNQSLIIGDQDDVTLNTDGEQTVSITGLDSNKEYSELKIVAYKAGHVGTEEFASTSTFKFSTIKYNIGSVTTPAVSDITNITSKTADINVTTSSLEPSDNESNIVNDYVLRVEDSKGVKIGSQADITLSKDGPQTISLTGLTWKGDYGDSKIVVYKSDKVGKIIGVLAKSNSFNLVIPKGTISGIDSATSIDREKITTETSFFINLTTTIKSYDLETDEFQSYDIIVYSDHDGITHDKIFTLKNQTDFKNAYSMEVTGLNFKTLYSNVTIELVSSDTQTTLGTETNSLGDVQTKDYDNMTITNGIINNSTEDGFDFALNINLIESSPSLSKNSNSAEFSGRGKMLPYKVKVNAIVGNNKDKETIWTSDKQETIPETLSLTVNNLLKDVIYKDISFQLIHSDDETKTFGDEFFTSTSIMPTNNVVDSISLESGNVISVSKKSFSFSIDINGINVDEKFVSPYKIAIFADGDDENYIWESDELLTVGKDMSFKIDDLKTGTKFKNIKVSLMNVNTDEKEKNFVSIAPMIHLKTNLPIIITFSVIFIILLILILSIFVNNDIQKRKRKANIKKYKKISKRKHKRLS